MKNKRTIITSVLGVLLLIGAYYLAAFFIESNKRVRPQAKQVVKTVFTEKAVNGDVPIIITTNGTLLAKHRIDIFSEVQGILNPSKKEFKPGVHYNKGETLISINSDEFYANLQAQKSNLYNVLTSVMPDIRLDYPVEYQKWQKYLNEFDVSKSVKPLPETTSEKEKFFISGRGILTAYYNVKNLEVKLSKYQIRAPFTGVLTASLVNEGTLVRPGQKLGEFIDPTIFEVGVSVKSQYADLLKVGKNVKLHNLENSQSWEGKVVRINGRVDSQTQTITAFIDVAGENLREGQYVEVDLEGKTEQNAYTVSRKLLIDNSKLYIVQNDSLKLIDVNPVYENKNTVVVKDIPNNAAVLSKPVPGAYHGMVVNVYKKTE